MGVDMYVCVFMCMFDPSIVNIISTVDLIQSYVSGDGGSVGVQVSLDMYVCVCMYVCLIP